MTDLGNKQSSSSTRGMSLQPSASITSQSATKSNSRLSWESIARGSRDSAARCARVWERWRHAVHDKTWAALGSVAAGPYFTQRAYSRYDNGGEGGRGMGIVLFGGGDPTGIKIAVDLAKRGYTVFAMIPVPPGSPPVVSHNLSSLVFSWSVAQRKLREKWPDHPGMVLPVTIDPPTEGPALQWVTMWWGPKSIRHLIHAGHTVREYCYAHDLALISVLVVASDYAASELILGPLPPSPPPRYITVRDRTYSVPRTSTLTPDDDPSLIITESRHFANTRAEWTYSTLMQSNCLEPRVMIIILKAMLTRSKWLGHGLSKVIYVTGELGVGVQDTHGAMRTLGVGRRKEAVTWMARTHDYQHKASLATLKADLKVPELSISEVVCGPLLQTQRRGGFVHSRHSSDASTGSGSSRRSVFSRVFSTSGSSPSTPPDRHPDDEDVMEARLARRFAEVARAWAVDEEYLFSVVARAVEDRYPLRRYRVGLSPILIDLSVYIPFFWLFQMIVQWVLRAAIVVSYYHSSDNGLGPHVNRLFGL